MLNGMLWIARSCAQWRELPEAYGPWQSVYARFAKWRDDGTLETVFHALSEDADMENLSMDSTCILSAGNDHDCVHAVELMKKVELNGSNVLADRAYGAQSIREYISEHGANYVIPPQSNVSKPWPVDWFLYQELHLIECFCQKIKWFHRIATRYGKLDESFLAFVFLAAIAILLI